MQRYRRNVVVDSYKPEHLRKPTARRALNRLTVADEDRFVPQPDASELPEPQIDWCRARIGKQQLIIASLLECGLDPAQDRRLLADLIELRNTLEKFRRQVCGRAAARHRVICRTLSERHRAS